MLGNDWRITRILLARQPRDANRPGDRHLRWATYTSLVISGGATMVLWENTIQQDVDFIVLLHAITGIICMFPLLLLSDYPAGGRALLIVALLLASIVLIYLVQAPRYLLLLSPYFGVCAILSSYTVFQIRQREDT